MIQVKKSIECSVNWKIPIKEAVLPFAHLGLSWALLWLCRVCWEKGLGQGPSLETPLPRGRTEGLTAGRGWGGGPLTVALGHGDLGLGGPSTASSFVAAPRTVALLANVSD